MPGKNDIGFFKKLLNHANLRVNKKLMIGKQPSYICHQYLMICLNCTNDENLFFNGTDMAVYLRRMHTTDCSCRAIMRYSVLTLIPLQHGKESKLLPLLRKTKEMETQRWMGEKRLKTLVNWMSFEE